VNDIINQKNGIMIKGTYLRRYRHDICQTESSPKLDIPRTKTEILSQIVTRLTQVT
jgi:hypothetical protein